MVRIAKATHLIMQQVNLMIVMNGVRISILILKSAHFITCILQWKEHIAVLC